MASELTSHPNQVAFLFGGIVTLALKRKATRERLLQDKQLKDAQLKFQQFKPADLDLSQGLLQSGSMCTASSHIDINWSYVPTVECCLGNGGHGRLCFNAVAVREFGWREHMQVAVFVDIHVKYLVLQNVRQHFESHMHPYKLGLFELRNTENRKAHLVRPETRTEALHIQASEQNQMPLERDVAAQSEMQIVDTFCGNSPAATILLLLLRSTINGLHGSDSKHLAICAARRDCAVAGIDSQFVDAVIAKLLQFAADGARNQWPKDFFA